MGRILLPDKAVVLMYDRGDVTVRNGIVSAVKLLDPAVYAVKSAQQAALLAQSVKENARLTALRKSFLSDPGYLSLSTRDRLTALDRFDEDYPGSGIRDDYDALMAVYEAELAAQAQLADLEKRLTDAEQQAADAEQQVADAQAQAAAAQQQAAATQASASQQNNQTGGYIGTTVVTSNGNGVYYLGNPYFQPPRWGPRGGSPHVFASGNTTASPQAAN
jgi:multidrug resistance efflux pump